MKKIFFSLIMAFLLVGCSESENDPKENINVSVTVEGVIYNGIETIFSASSSGDIKEATFYFNGQSIGSVISEPFNIKYTPKDILPGNHTIKCVVISDLGNRFEGETSTNLKLRLGDEFQGGKIFYLENSGESGLISSLEDMSYNEGFGVSYGLSWGGYGVLLGTTKSNGKANTQLMAANSTYPSQAGYNFKNGYNYNGYSDWYIPSLEELEILIENNAYVGTFERSDTNWENFYWSSSESNEVNAFCLNFYALAGNNVDKSYNRKVRPIRSF